MCDVCSDFLQLLVSCESRANNEENQSSTIKKNEVEIALLYIQTWPQRQCMCCYRDIKNFERFNIIVQSIISLTICQLKTIEEQLEKLATLQDNDNKPIEEIGDNENWTLPEIEKLLLLLSKVFLLNFPLYIAYKHGLHSRLDELPPQEIALLNNFCDLHDNEMPLFLLRNVSFFCKNNGVHAIADCFDLPNLPVSVAHAITATVCNLKLWLNYRSIVQLFVPLRNKVLKYMCRLPDQDLRSPATRTMAGEVL